MKSIHQLMIYISVRYDNALDRGASADYVSNVRNYNQEEKGMKKGLCINLLTISTEKYPHLNFSKRGS